jgi:hypothetical protein
MALARTGNSIVTDTESMGYQLLRADLVAFPLCTALYLPTCLSSQQTIHTALRLLSETHGLEKQVQRQHKYAVAKIVILLLQLLLSLLLLLLGN